MAGSFGEKLVRVRWWIIAAWLIVPVVLGVLAPTTDPAATELRTFLPDGSPSLRAAEALRKHFPGWAGLSQAVVVLERQGPAASPAKLTPGDLLALEGLLQRLRRPLPEALARSLPGGKLSVRGPSDFPEALQPNPMISPDGTTAIAVVEIPANFVTIRSARAVQYVRELTRETGWPDGLAVAVTGSAAFGADYAEATNRSHRKTLWVTVLAVLVILLAVYRAPAAAAAVLGTISLAAVVAHLVLAYAAAWGLHVGTAESIFVYVLLYGLGVDYSLLYLSRFREFLGEGRPPGCVRTAGRQAAAAAWSATAPAIGASSGTDIAGLGMLSFAAFKVFRTTGHVVPIALLVALAAALTLVPALAAVAHRRLFWPGSRVGYFGADRLWSAVADGVTRRPGAVLVLTVLALVVPAVMGAGNRYVYDTLTDLRPQYGSVRGRQMVQRHWPPGQATPVSIVLESASGPAGGDLEPTSRRLTEALEKIPGVADVRSASQPLGRAGKNLYTRTLLSRPEARAKVNLTYLAPATGAARLEVVPAANGFSNEAMATLRRIEQTCEGTLPAGVANSFAGATAYMSDIRDVTRRDFHLISALVLAVVFLLVLALLRDALLSGFMVAATVLSYLATLGVTHVFFVWALGGEGLDWKVQVFLFVVLVAVGQDYNIFLAARLAEESRHAGPRQAARIAVVKTGGIISSAGVIMAATLGSLLVGDILLLVQLGFACAVGMLLDTFIVRPLLLPAFAALTGRTGRPLSKP